jgi:uncharacterized protein (DUF1778 family)
MAKFPRLRDKRRVYGLRLAESEKSVIQAAAANSQEYMAEFIRRVVLEAARRDLNNRAP